MPALNLRDSSSASTAAGTAAHAPLAPHGEPCISHVRAAAIHGLATVVELVLAWPAQAGCYCLRGLEASGRRPFHAAGGPAPRGSQGRVPSCRQPTRPD